MHTDFGIDHTQMKDHISPKITFHPIACSGMDTQLWAILLPVFPSAFLRIA